MHCRAAASCFRGSLAHCVWSQPCQHQLSSTNWGNIPEESGASTITANRAGTVSLAVEIPASSIIIADLTMAGSVVVDIVEEGELPRRRGGDEESGEKCELHGEVFGSVWLQS